MNIILITKENFFNIKENNKTNLVLGFFDGVHKGHLKLINESIKDNENTSILTFIKSFKENDEVITSNEEKEEILSKIGVKTVYYLSSDIFFKEMKDVDFIDKILKKINPNKLYCGSDFRFGYLASGDINLLKKEFGDNLKIVDFLLDENGNKISSSYIKKLIKEGKIKEANSYLYSNYKVEGKVIKGNGIGNKELFPTINLKLSSNFCLPKNGVYKTRCIIDKDEFISITNVGVHPTIDKLNQPIIETFILNYNSNLYDKFVSVEFLDFIRDEKKFNSLEELKKQIEKDIKKIG